MSYWHFPITCHMYVIVDRIEGEYAILEWENLALSSLHLSMLSFEPKEGMQLLIKVYPSPLGNTYAIGDDPGVLYGLHPLVIPMPNVVIAGLHYQYTIQEIPWMQQ